ncbi:hypothetical protein Ciccas_010777 [Cichlidogyrus casuarinus]|uniref:Uncharacterized protein n=1 Tax=Cichlidogyrus casuarinus TaxID=1844966 RepID=A0ABD2PT45_9PLAT
MHRATIPLLVLFSFIVTGQEIVPSLPHLFANHTREDFLVKSKECPAACISGLDSDAEVTCSDFTSDSYFPKMNFTDLRRFKCTVNELGGISIGKKETVKTIAAGSLVDLIEISLETGLIPPGSPIHLNLKLNIVELQARTFKGIQDRLTGLKIYNVYKIHPDSLVDLHHLSSLEFETKGLPKPFLDEKILGNAQVLSQQEKEELLPKIPPFLRLRFADDSLPLALNLPFSCHQCATQSSNEKPLIILILRPSQPKGGLSLFFPKSCRVSPNDLGCPNLISQTTNLKLNDEPEQQAQTNLTESQASGDRSGDSLFDQLNFKDPMLEQDSSDSREEQRKLNQSEGGSGSKVKLALMLLAIWCTIITLILVLVAVITAKRRSQRKIMMLTPCPSGEFQKFEVRRESLISGSRSQICINGTVNPQFFTPLHRSPSQAYLPNELQRPRLSQDEDMKSLTTSSGFYTPSLAMHGSIGRLSLRHSQLDMSRTPNAHMTRIPNNRHNSYLHGSNLDIMYFPQPKTLGRNAHLPPAFKQPALKNSPSLLTLAPSTHPTKSQELTHLPRESSLSSNAMNQIRQSSTDLSNDLECSSVKTLIQNGHICQDMEPPLVPPHGKRRQSTAMYLNNGTGEEHSSWE